MSGSRPVERHAERLVRCYPRGWRERYADEFTALLVDELSDTPRSVGRELDVVAHGLWTRLTYAGLAGSVAEPSRRIRATLIALMGVCGVFGLLAVGVWSQLTVGWQWSAPANAGTHAAVWVMSAALFGCGALGVLTLVPLWGRLLITGVRRRNPGLSLPVLVASLAAVVLALGCHHFGPHWPGSGGHAWAGRDLVPAWLARLGWAGTLWISAYWAHPSALGAFPAGEIAWMLLSPVAWLVLLISGPAALGRCALTPRLRRWVVLMCSGGLGLMGTFLVGALLWVSAGDSGPRNLFAAGTIDLAIVALLGGGLITATHLLRRVSAVARHPARS